MRVLLVAATAFEIAPALARAGVASAPTTSAVRPGEIVETEAFDLLITGIGQMQCATHISRALLTRMPEMVVQAGIAGSFTERLGKGAVALVGAERLADLGAETSDGFADIVDMGLLKPDGPPFSDGWLKAPRGCVPSGIDLPFVRSVTVNRVLSAPASIAWVRQRYDPDLVNMEGAALFHACLLQRVPFIEIRAVSDMVGPRDTRDWDIAGAVEALDARLWALLEGLGGASSSP